MAFNTSQRYNRLQERVPNAVRDVFQNENLREGRITRTMEGQTARIPSATWLTLAVGSMAASAALEVFSRRKEYGNFVGLWAPTFLLIGIYNKLVKLEG